MTDAQLKLAFQLHDSFAAAHFDLATYLKPRTSSMIDARKLETTIHFLVNLASARRQPKATRTLAQDALLQIDMVVTKMLQDMQVEVDHINTRFTTDPLCSSDTLPSTRSYVFSLRWDDRRMWGLVRGLLLIDTANRQLMHLMSRSAFSFDDFKNIQTALVQPWRHSGWRLLNIAKSVSSQVKSNTTPQREAPKIQSDISEGEASIPPEIRHEPESPAVISQVEK